MTAKRFEVSSVGQVSPLNDERTRKVSMRLACGAESFVFHMPEGVAAELLEKLQGINPRKAIPVTKL